MEMAPGILKVLLEWGLAGVLLYLYVRQQDKHEAAWQQTTKDMLARFEELNSDNALLIKECTTAFTRCLQLMSDMQRQMDRWDGHERRTSRKSAG